MKTLLEISNKWSQQQDVGHGDKGTTHSYIPEYEKLFSPYRDKKINFLEIGVAYGASLEMWYEYFNKQSKIFGVDIYTNEIAPYLSDDRFEIDIVDASKEDIKILYKDTKFDIIIDDGSHQLKDQISTFNFLKDNIKEGGLFIIEDILDLDNSKNEFENLANQNNLEFEILDLRPIKNRYDDVLIVYKF